MAFGILFSIVRSSSAACWRRRRPLLCVVLMTMVPIVVSGQATATSSALPLTGNVVNARTGAPMTRVLVQANDVVMFTNAEGRFTLPGSSGVTSLRLTKPGFSLSPEQRDPETITLDPAASQSTLEVELWPEAVLAGTVTSSEGDPVPHLTVSAERILFHNGLRQVSSVASTSTDAHGSFRIPVPAGNYTLRTQYARPDLTRGLAVLPTQRPSHTADDASGTIHIASGEELHVDLHAVLAAAFRTTIPLQGSNGQRYSSVTLTTSEGVSFQPPQSVTPEGVVLTLPAGSYRLSARLGSPEGQLFGQEILTVPEHDSTSGPLHLEAMAATPIVVAVDSASIPAANGSAVILPDVAALNLQLEPDSSTALDGNGQAVRSNGRGTQSFFLVPPGTYHLVGGENSSWTLQSATFGGVDLLRNPFVVGASSGSEPVRIAVTHANGSISGMTRIAGVAARCWIVVVPEAGMFPRFFVRRSGANGTFQITNLPLRTFRLLALPLLSSADFGQTAQLDQFDTYVQTIAVTSSSSAPLTLDAVPVHELYP